MTKKTLEITIVTANLLHGQPFSHPKADLSWVRENWKPDIIGCQEAEDYGSVLHSIADYGVALNLNTPGSGREDAVLYNKRSLKLISAVSHKVTSGRAHHDPDRYVNEVHFVDRYDGQNIWYYNTHANHKIDAGGHPIPEPQTAAATEHFTKLAIMVSARAKSTDAVVFWGGDLNVDENADNKFSWKGFPNAIFHKYNLLSIYDELHLDFPGRTIDVVGSCNQDAGVKALSVIISPDMFSDHRFYRARYSIPRKASSGGSDQPKDNPETGKKDITDVWGVEVWPDLPDTVPVPIPDDPLNPVLHQPVGTWDHSVCCKK